MSYMDTALTLLPFPAIGQTAQWQPAIVWTNRTHGKLHPKLRHSLMLGMCGNAAFLTYPCAFFVTSMSHLGTKREKH